jgi:hypothetical protein
MSWEPTALATVAADELGADVAAVRVAGLLEDDEYHLTGVDVLLAAGMAIAAAFCAGLVQGVIDEIRQNTSKPTRPGDLTDWGHGTGAGLVRQLRRFSSRFIKRGESDSSEVVVADSENLKTEFSFLIATVRENLIDNQIAISQIRVAAEGSKGEVRRILIDLGLQSGRAEELAPRFTEALADEFIDGLQ